MSKSTAVPPVKEEIQAAEVSAVVVEAKAPVAAESEPSKAKQAVATVAAVEKLATKPKVVKKAVAAKPDNKEVAAKPAPAPKVAAKAVKKTPVATKEKVAETPKVEKAAKVAKVKKVAPKKPKLVRDSFTIPDTDYALFATLKQRALAAGVEVKKGEILRAAVVALSKLDDAELVKAIGLVERIKTGRPKK